MNRVGATLLVFFLLAGVGCLAILRFDRAPRSGRAAPAASPVAVLRMPVAGMRPEQLAGASTHAPGNDAIEIMAPTGTPVLAATDGRVEKLLDTRRAGHALYLRAPDGGTVTYYAHLDRYAPGIAEGARVRAGAPIAYVGYSGGASPAAPNLHFEVHRMAPGEGWWQGTRVDPYPLLTHEVAG